MLRELSLLQCLLLNSSPKSFQLCLHITLEFGSSILEPFILQYLLHLKLIFLLLNISFIFLTWLSTGHGCHHTTICYHEIRAMAVRQLLSFLTFLLILPFLLIFTFMQNSILKLTGQTKHFAF